ncbi:GNAT family N-acetyltransferase [Tenacibaculum sp. MAR_2009_124]|uniref:GNAT family N-acetyltransferase n=1 Tax=Tenacibaculum sp. MAR_2009_124 TaxID=1250059 RepID=UPI001C408FCA|nr:GNAT family N-acetyltransferase [Tenacibaculum sp. MAR_2009_124]
MMSIIEQQIFSKEIEGVGRIVLRPIHLKDDIDILYSWVKQPYAKYWGMLDFSKEQVYNSYDEIEKNPHHHTYIGMLNDRPIFLMERYKASEDIIAKHYDFKLNDYGMHILVAPVEKRIPQFTWCVFSTIMDYFFSLPYVERVVVEPDANNKKIHKLNMKAGFVYQKEIKLPHKVASLAICTKQSYEEALNKLHSNE